MKKYFSLVFVISLFCIANAQSYAKYWVQFKDKANSKYSIERPSEFLSPAAIALREKNNIAIDELDLPVNDNYIKEVMALDHNMRLFTRSKWLNGITVYSEDSTILQKILQLPCVAFAEKTVTMKEPETVCIQAKEAARRPCTFCRTDRRLTVTCEVKCQRRHGAEGKPSFNRAQSMLQ